MRVGLDALLQSAGPEGTAEIEDMVAPDGQADAPLIHLCAGPGRASVTSLRDELARLDTVRDLGLPDGLFADWSRAELEACRQRVAVETPYELAGIPRPPVMRGSRPTPICAGVSSSTRSSIC